METFPTYQRYKNSAVTWIGEIPEHWSAKRLKYLADITLGKMLTPSKKGSMTLKPYLRSANVQDGHIDTSDIKDMWFSNKEVKELRLRCGDLLVNEGGQVGRTSQWEGQIEECYIQNSINRVRVTEKLNSRYALYVFQACFHSGHFDSIVNRVSIPHLTKDKLRPTKIVQPPLDEQHRIAKFLDQKTAEIDETIAKKLRLIELLEEHKAILINQAVTKGLDPHASMCDSGVNWIGEVPKHWTIRKVKHLFRLVAEPAAKNNDHELLSVYTDIGVRPRKDLEERGNKASTTDGYWLVKNGDIIVNKLLAWMGAIGLSNYDGVTSPAYDILRSTEPVDGNYYHNMFRMAQCSQELKKHSRGIMDMRLRLYFDKLGQILVPYPPIDEQRTISKRLADIDEQYGHAEKLIVKELENLEELKRVLISNAVTGKIKL